MRFGSGHVIFKLLSEHYSAVLLSSGMWHCLHWYIVASVSEEIAAFFFRVENGVRKFLLKMTALFRLHGVTSHKTVISIPIAEEPQILLL
jgi:hypothetical protein